MAKIGTICDNYKVQMFEKGFTDAHIIISEIKALTATTSLIVCHSEQYIVKPIVDKVTQYFIDNPPKK